MEVGLKNVAVPMIVGVLWLLATIGIVSYVKGNIEDIAADAVRQALMSIEPAIQWKGVDIETPIVKINDELKITYRVRIKKQCPADLRAFLIDSKGGAAYRFPDTQGGYRKADPIQDQYIPISVVIQDPPPPYSQFKPIKPGRYCYRTTAIRFCDTVQLDSEVPDACFDLIR